MDTIQIAKIQLPWSSERSAFSDGSLLSGIIHAKEYKRIVVTPVKSTDSEPFHLAVSVAHEFIGETQQDLEMLTQKLRSYYRGSFSELKFTIIVTAL